MFSMGALRMGKMGSKPIFTQPAHVTLNKPLQPSEMQFLHLKIRDDSNIYS